MSKQKQYVVKCIDPNTGDVFNHRTTAGERGAVGLDDDGSLVFEYLDDATKAISKHVYTGMKITLETRDKPEPKNFKIMGYDPGRNAGTVYRSLSFPASYTLEEAVKLVTERNERDGYGTGRPYRTVVYFVAPKTPSDSEYQRY